MAIAMVALALLIVLPVNSDATEWVVDDDGGTWSDHSTIGSAIAGASDGDTIEVYNGTYNEHLTVSKELTFVGNDSSEVMLNNEHTINASNVSLDGFTFANSDDYTILIDASTRDIDNVSITNCTFELVGWSGVHLGGDTGSAYTISNIAMNYNTFDGPSNMLSNPFKVGGTFGDPGGQAVDGVEFQHNAVWEGSIPIQLNDKDINDVLINDNTFNNTDGIVYVWGDSTPTGVLSNFVFTNNEVDDTNSYGVGIGYPNGTFSPANLGTGNAVNYNNIDVAGAYGIGGLSNFMGGPLDGTYNWWGASDGPSGSGSGSGSPVSDNVTFNPFYTEMVGNVTNSLVMDITGDEIFDGFVGEIDGLTIDGGYNVTFTNSVITINGDLDITDGSLTFMDVTIYVGDITVAAGGTWLV